MFNKKQDINYLIIKITELYELLENYIWSNNNKNYHIIIQDKEETLEIKFLKNNELLDSLILTFNKNERKLHEYITLSYIYNIFKYVTISKSDNKFYNQMQKPYLEFIEEDKILLDKCQKIGSMINSSKNKEINSLLEKQYLEIKRSNRIIDNNTKICIDQRLILTKKIFKRGIYE